MKLIMAKKSKTDLRIQEMIEQTEKQMEMMREEYKHLDVRLQTLMQAQDNGEEEKPEEIKQ